MNPNVGSSNSGHWFGIKPSSSSQKIRISKFEKIKWQRSVFNPQKSLWPESKYFNFCYQCNLLSPESVTKLISISASTSTLKSPLSPRPNLMPFPSRETASATKCHQFWCHQLWCHHLQSCNLKPPCGIRFLAHVSVHLFWQHISIHFIMLTLVVLSCFGL